MPDQPQTSDIRYDVYIDSIRDEESKKKILMFLAGIVRHIQLEDIISGISMLPFKVVNAVTEQTAVKLQERLGVRGATVRLVQLVPGSVASTNAPNLSATVLHTESTQTASDAVHHLTLGSFGPSVQPDAQDFRQAIPPESNFLARLWRNWVDVMFNAPSFFQGVDTEKQLHFPVIFAVVWGTIALILNMPTILYTRQTFVRFFAGGMPGRLSMPVSAYVSLFIMAPFFLFITLFVMSGIYHMFVLLVGGKGGFGSTLKVLAYSMGAMVLEVIPFLGIPIFWFYALYLYTMGFKELHKISTTRAFVAAIMPVVILFVFVFVMVALVIFGFGVDLLREFRPQVQGIPI
ncbi:MAG: YIP1 family protein [Deltaproteobacteria bacterium]|nr:YIP1 family protein [Deltaproteobacteria bacterium]MCL5277602.1 YIP1 family protein [Deltaproteobacteria bacterium]